MKYDFRVVKLRLVTLVQKLFVWISSIGSCASLLSSAKKASMIKPRVFGTKNITKFKNQVLILNNYILYAVFICQGKFLILGKISFNLKDAVKLRCLEAIKKHIKFKIKLKRHKENCHFTTQIFYFFILVNLILISALELWLLEN